MPHAKVVVGSKPTDLFLHFGRRDPYPLSLPRPPPKKKPNVTLEVATDALILFTTAKITTTYAR